MRNKFHNIKSDGSLLKSDVLILTETWLEVSTDVSEYHLPEYMASLNNSGRGRGIASYFKDEFGHEVNINREGFSISKLESDKMDIIGLYRSQGRN